MLALAKPPSMSRGKHEEGGGSTRLIADDCLKYLFIYLKKVTIKGNT
jgi:predicted P-loop ATPase/GTPase